MKYFWRRGEGQCNNHFQVKFKSEESLALTNRFAANFMERVYLGDLQNAVYTSSANTPFAFFVWEKYTELTKSMFILHFRLF